MSTEQTAASPRKLSPPAAIVATAVLVFIGFSALWLLDDHRLPGGGDPARHLATTLEYADLIGDGDIGTLLEIRADGDSFFYPPLVRLVGAIPAAFGLAVEDWGTLMLNLVFVPLLAAACFLIGRLVYGPRAGVLAAIFALGTPIVLSLFHVFLLDAPLAACVGITLWALLASQRFARRRESVLAGVLLGVALLVKTVAPIFLIGPIAVMLIGGGWRQWRNIALFGVIALAIAAPYYVIHLDHLFDISNQATTTGLQQGAGTIYGGYERFSVSNLTWYGWAALNIQYFLPLLALFAIGLVASLREVRRRTHLLELLVGLATGYLLVTFALSIRDPRYTVPLVVFVAVIATGWITTTKLRWARIAGTAVLAVAVLANLAVAATDGLPTLRINENTDQFSDVVERGALTVLDDRGYVVGPPRSDPFWERLLETAEREGLETAKINVHEAPTWGTDVLGFDLTAKQHGIDGESYVDGTLERADLVINTWFSADGYWVDDQGYPPPCARVNEGTNAPVGSEAVALAVSVSRLGPDGYERWCDFLE
ncbi:MAG: ArnT family glycosyltransferase [Solirubrobacterales bacterium]